MSIAPVCHSLEVKGSPERAFELFTSQMGKWWPGGRTPAANPAVDVVVESRQGGRWYEVDAEGNETQWGSVVTWAPPHRLVLGWQLGRDWRFEPVARSADAELLAEQRGSARGHSMSTTPWFKRGTKPAHVGVYECAPDPAYVNAMTFQHWNGTLWGVYATNTEYAFEARMTKSTRQNPTWRGLAEKPA